MGAEVGSRAQFRFAECSFPKRVCCRPEITIGGGPSGAGQVWVAGACVNKAFSCNICLLPVGEHIWSGFNAEETTRHAARPTEPEAAQTLLGPMGSIGPGEN